jgi:uncharacterized protein YceK
MRRYIILLVTFFSILILTGCGTIFNGTKAKVEFQSIPMGAKVKVDNQNGSTPCSFYISKKTESYYIEKEGYLSEVCPLGKRVSAVAILDVFLWFIPLGVDYVTGGLWVVDPKQLVYLKEGPGKVIEQNKASSPILQ